MVYFSTFTYKMYFTLNKNYQKLRQRFLTILKGRPAFSFLKWNVVVISINSPFKEKIAKYALNLYLCNNLEDVRKNRSVTQFYRKPKIQIK